MFAKFVQGFKTTFQRHTVDKDDSKVWQEFQSWYASALGQQLASSEKQIMDKYLPDLFGYFLLQCGCPDIKSELKPGDWLKSSRVSTHYCLENKLNQGVSCQSCFERLPIKSDMIDIVVLPHVLEFSSEPHQVLREVERILIAEGHVIIIGFNPWSLWNVFRLFHFWTKHAPWNKSFIAASRVIDWLSLLGFEVIQRQGYFYKPPIQNEKLINKLNFFENLGKRIWPNLGAGYVLVARKRVETLTPIRPRWRTRRQVVTGGFETVNRNKM